MEEEVSDYFLECSTCGRGLVYSLEYPRHDESDLWRALPVWPDSGLLDDTVPVIIRQCYEEAVKVKPHSPGSFAVQIRRALEALCHDRGAGEDNLAKGLRVLAERNEIPDLLAEMTDLLRLLGNAGAHFDLPPVLREQVRAIDDFFRAVVEYVYVAPARVQQVRRELERLRKR